MNRTRILPALILLLGLRAPAQSGDAQVLTLEACIGLALEHNLDLKTSELQAETAQVNYKIALNRLLPDVNGEYNLGVNDGRSIDPFTNAYINEKFTFSNLGLNLNAVVFNGFRQLNTLKQNRLNLEAAEMELDAFRQTLVLRVTLAFLKTLNAREMVRLTVARTEATQGQLDRLQALYDQQLGNPAEYRDLQGQHANDRATLAQARNALKAAVYELETLLNAKEPIDPETMGLLIDFEPYAYTAEQVYAQALEKLAALQASRLRLEAARKGVAAARGQFTPTFSIFAGLSTNYSSLARLFDETGTRIAETGDFVTVGGLNYPVQTQVTDFEEQEIAYWDQFDNNRSTFYGVSASIPIFNGFRAHSNLRLEKIRREQAKAELDQSELQFHQSIRAAHSDMETALERYRVLEEQVAAYEESFRINEIRFSNGVSNSTEYIVSKNNLDNARISLSNLRYEYVLRVQVLEYYRGEAL